MIEIQEVKLDQLDELMKWRMDVIREVFDEKDEALLNKLEKLNRIYYEKNIPNNEHTACFAYKDGKIIGCGGICFSKEMPSPDNPLGTCGYLMNIYTDPNYRKEGAARQTVNWLIEKANQAGTGKIYLEASKEAISLYKSLGFEELEDMFKLKGNPAVYEFYNNLE